MPIQNDPNAPVESPYFIHNRHNQCLAALGDAYVRFINCDGKEINDKLWVSEANAIRNIKTNRCLGLKDACSASKLDLVFAADSAPARLYPCDQLKGKLTWQDNDTRLCCPKGNNQRACLSFKTVNKDGHAVNLVDPNPDNKIYVKPYDRRALQDGCCSGEITDEICGPFKPGSSRCGEVYSGGPAETTGATSPASWPLWMWILLLVVVAVVAYVVSEPPKIVVRVASAN